VILDAVAAKMPEIYCLVHAAYSCDPILVYGQILDPEKAHIKEIRWDHWSFAKPYIRF